MSSPPGTVISSVCSRPSRSSSCDGHVELPRHGLVERQVALAVHLQLAHLDELAVRAASSHGSVLKLQEPQPHPQPRRRPGLQQALGPLPPRVRRARDGLPGRATRLDPVPRVRARRTASAPGSSRTTSGTGRAGNPRRAPRPPPNALTHIPQAMRGRHPRLDSRRRVGPGDPVPSAARRPQMLSHARWCHTVPCSLLCVVSGIFSSTRAPRQRRSRIDSRMPCGGTEVRTAAAGHTVTARNRARARGGGRPRKVDGRRRS